MYTSLSDAWDKPQKFKITQNKYKSIETFATPEPFEYNEVELFVDNNHDDGIIGILCVLLLLILFDESHSML